MSRGESNSWGSERDFLCKGPSACLLWCVPWVAFAIGFSVAPGLRTVLWTTSLAVMDVVCLLNPFPLRSWLLPLQRTIFGPWCSYLPGLWPRPTAAWTVRVELAWPRN